MNRDDALAALHALVDMLDANPELPVPEVDDSICVDHNVDLESLIRLMAAGGPCVIEQVSNNDYVRVVRDFGGGVKYRLFVNAERLGEAHTELREVTEWRLRPSVEAALQGMESAQ